MHSLHECRINGLQLTELKYENLVGTPVVLITYALTELAPKTKKLVHTHGKVTATGANLSQKTWELFQQFLTAAEADLESRHFDTTTTEKVTEEKEDGTTGTTVTRSDDPPEF